MRAATTASSRAISSSFGAATAWNASPPAASSTYTPSRTQRVHVHVEIQRRAEPLQDGHAATTPIAKTL